ncbi:MAG: methyltransferase domain-containing protein [Anaerolineae bacterium]|nr:methyltransferase domain-containing protein [Anaerolineae bacterium]
MCCNWRPRSRPRRNDASQDHDSDDGTAISNRTRLAEGRLPGAAVTIQQAYDEWAATYDSDLNRTRDLDALVAERVLGGRSWDAILEIGCGTGKNTPLLARIGGRVCALDFSTGMLRRAREKVHAPNVSWVAADLSRPWPLKGGGVDLIACDLVLEHIADLAFVFSEAARVLAEKGWLFVCELHSCRQYQGVRARYQRGDETVGVPAFVHHLSDFSRAARAAGLNLERLEEWWHEQDGDGPPRLVSFLFAR